MFPIPCRCCLHSEPSPQSIPCNCGKLANPRPVGETANARRLRLLPITDSLETDRHMKLRKRIENRIEIRKTQDIAKFRTEAQMEERSMDLERKSDRLKRILDDEMFGCTQQILNAFEQQRENRIGAMKQRVAVLREQREKEEKKLVQSKLEQYFLNTSEELRTLRVSKMAKEIAKDWDEQIRMKYRLECEQEENDRLYDYLWLKDAENKLKREKAYDCMRAEAIRKASLELQKQNEIKRMERQLQDQVQERETAIADNPVSVSSTVKNGCPCLSPIAPFYV